MPKVLLCIGVVLREGKVMGMCEVCGQRPATHLVVPRCEDCPHNETCENQTNDCYLEVCDECYKPKCRVMEVV